MNEPKEKQETMKEAYERVFNYDPSEEEVDAKYDEDFNKWEKEFINRKL